MLKPTLIAIPFFALLIALEAWYAMRRDPSAYEAKDAWNNILIGFTSVAFGAFFGLFFGLVYLAAYELARTNSPLTPVDVGFALL